MEKPSFTSLSDEESRSSELLLPLPSIYPRTTSQSKTSRPHNLYFWSSCILNIVLVLLLAFLNKPSLGQQTLESTSSFYTPVQHLLEPLHARPLTNAFGIDKTIYQGQPSAEKNAHWRALYVEALTIPRSSAEKFHNRTVPVNSSPDTDYVVGLNVFHYLHCLHYITNALDFFHYPETSGLNATNNPYDGVHRLEEYDDHDKQGMLDPEHLGYCIDTIRQALMCHADTSTYVWQHDSAENKTSLYQNTMHMCTDFSSLREWAGERRFDGVQYEENFEYEAWREQRAVGGCGYEDECGERGLPAGNEGWRRENEWRDSERWIAMDERIGKGDGTGQHHHHGHG